MAPKGNGIKLRVEIICANKAVICATNFSKLGFKS